MDDTQEVALAKKSALGNNRKKSVNIKLKNRLLPPHRNNDTTIKRSVSSSTHTNNNNNDPLSLIIDPSPLRRVSSSDVATVISELTTDFPNHHISPKHFPGGSSARFVASTSSSSTTTNSTNIINIHRRAYVQVVSDRQLARLIRALKKRRRGIPKKYQQQQEGNKSSNDNLLLKEMKKIFSFPIGKSNDCKWLYKPLYNALLEGDEKLLNAVINPPSVATAAATHNNKDLLSEDGVETIASTYSSAISEDLKYTRGMPMLCWLCQWRYLKAVYDWESYDHKLILSLFLGAGADPNVSSPTSSGNFRSSRSKSHHSATPIFFAVKYGCLKTVKLLVRYGAVITKKKDSKGRSCLWSALSKPQPDIIRYLLERHSLPADEKFPVKNKNKDIAKTNLTAVDYIFDTQCSYIMSPSAASSFYNNRGIDNKGYPKSWQILGEPSEDDIIETLVEFGKRGVTLSSKSLSISLFSYFLHEKDLAADNSSSSNNKKEKIVGDDPNNCYVLAAKERVKRIVNFMVGKYLPPSQYTVIMPTTPKKLKEDASSQSVSQDTVMTQLSTQASCGGGQQDSKLSMKEKKRRLSSSQKKIDDEEDWDGYFAGPKALTYHQLMIECQARGIHIPNIAVSLESNNKDQLCHLLKKSMKETQYYYEEEKSDEKTVEFIANSSSMSIDNTTTRTESSSLLFLPNTSEAVTIPIVVHGIPILAFLSFTSDVTLLSPEFVHMFGLRRKKLQSSLESINNNVEGSAQDTIATSTTIDELRLQLIGSNDMGKETIEVCLPNAVESSLLPNHVGIQLGLDFLRSGAWCVVDVAIPNNSDKINEGNDEHGNNDHRHQQKEKRRKQFVLMDGFGHKNILSDIAKFRKKRNELRYFSHQCMDEKNNGFGIIQMKLLPIPTP